MAPPVTVDFHAHAQSPKAAELIASAANNPGADANLHNQHLFVTRYQAAFSDIAVRMQTMDRQRIDMQVVSPAPNYAYWADEATSPHTPLPQTSTSRRSAHYPDRLVGLGHVSPSFRRSRRSRSARS
jgi:aminocarboxymuconate-semialdehyde decarboxylase